MPLMDFLQTLFLDLLVAKKTHFQLVGISSCILKSIGVRKPYFKLNMVNFFYYLCMKSVV